MRFIGLSHERFPFSIVSKMILLLMSSTSEHEPNITEEPSWSWSYGRWIYNYLCNQCLSPLKLWVQIPLMARCTRNIYSTLWFRIWKHTFDKGPSSDFPHIYVENS